MKNPFLTETEFVNAVRAMQLICKNENRLGFTQGQAAITDYDEFKEIRKAQDRFFEQYVEYLTAKMLRCLEKQEPLLKGIETSAKAEFEVEAEYIAKRQVLTAFCERLAKETSFFIMAMRLYGAERIGNRISVKIVLYG